MKNILIILSLISLTSCFIGSGENSPINDIGKNKFPELVGIDLNGKKHNLPSAFEGEYNIIALGFEREHQEAINTWITEIDKLNLVNNKIKFYEVPLIYELGKFSRTWVNNGMRIGIQNEIARKRTITVYTNRDKFYKIMNMKGDRIYLIILNKSNDIIWRSEGYASTKNLDSFKKFIEKIR